MTSEPLKPSVDELKYFIAAVIITGAAYTAYTRSYEIGTAGFFLGVAALILFTRELGQRAIAQAMDADVELHISFQGSIITAFGAFITIVTSLPFILLFPVYNTYSTERYEHWGKSIDAIWLKRQFWLASGSIVFLFLGWALSYWLGYLKVAEAYSLFTLFQLMPFDYPAIPTGKLDGSVILKQSGFMWLLYFGITWVTLAVIWV